MRLRLRTPRSSTEAVLYALSLMVLLLTVAVVVLVASAVATKDVADLAQRAADSSALTARDQDRAARAARTAAALFDIETCERQNRSLRGSERVAGLLASVLRASSRTSPPSKARRAFFREQGREVEGVVRSLAEQRTRDCAAERGP